MTRVSQDKQIWDRFDDTIDLIDKKTEGVRENSKLRYKRVSFSYS